MVKLRLLFFLLAVLAFFVGGCVPLIPSNNDTNITPSIVADNQNASSIILIRRVDAANDSWVVIHQDANGTVGEILGYNAVNAGINNNVTVGINLSKATSRLFAMLHIDAGSKGIFEFPGRDAPVTVLGREVSASFLLLGLSNLTGNFTNATSGNMSGGNATSNNTTNLLCNSTVACVFIRNDSFVPSIVEVQAGGSVLWENQDDELHTVTGFGVDVELDPEELFMHRFYTQGNYAYNCTVHPGMSGEVRVTSASNETA